MNASMTPNRHDNRDVTILVIRPHPDDESSATGGMLAHYHAQGVRTGVVICTGGEEGEIHDPDLDAEADKPRLREIREQELRNACSILGVSELRLLGYRDSGMAETPANSHPEAFWRADRTEAVGRLVRVIRELRPHVIVTEQSGGAYSHPDHVMCHVVSVAAFHAAGDVQAYPEAGTAWNVSKLYTIAHIDDGAWETLRPEFKAAGFDLGKRRPRRKGRPSPEAATVALDVRPYSDIQRRALLAHRTQIPLSSMWARLPDELYRRAFATAYFMRVHPPAAAQERESDLCHGVPLPPSMLQSRA
ncbi:PIG-L family deacetylase [Candidatus Entotheonella palauensis]|uniref:PIG-L family deacetylase n=1 Tax=Candidatus Entotheonella palauensis TaxID=93172 RepID=UPI000B7DB610|nr:PIG-L family deacetylase [Candidatus Entotheonella palauensis]